MWELIFSVVLVGIGMALARQFKRRRFLHWNTLFATLLLLSVFLIPRIVPAYRQPDSALVLAAGVREHPPSTVGPPVGLGSQTPSAPWSRLAARVGLLRHKFIISYPLAGSNIDGNVELTTLSDLIRYLPRAMLIGFFSPFPNMWFARGEQVGIVGRLVSGAETLTMYLLEALALVSLVINRRHMSVWLISLIVTLGCTALGYVVVNISTLYRMRYVFWILLIILAADAIQSTKKPGLQRLEHEESVEALQPILNI